LLKRIVTGLLLGAFAAGGLLWPGGVGAVWFLVLALGFVALALTELAGLLGRAGSPVYTAPMTLAGLALVFGDLAPSLLGGVFVQWREGPFAAAALAVAVAWMAGLAARRPALGEGVRRLIASLGALLLVWGTLGWMPRLYGIAGCGLGEGRWLLLFMIAVTKAADIGAYALGTWTAARPRGNHKMCPGLSPKKSWEGLAGGVVLAVAVAVALVWLWRERFALHGEPILTVWVAALLGALFAVLGLAGDLTESMLKRAAGVKDSGALPGLGGCLDVVDSLIYVAPLFYAWVAWAR